MFEAKDENGEFWEKGRNSMTLVTFPVAMSMPTLTSQSEMEG